MKRLDLFSGFFIKERQQHSFNPFDEPLVVKKEPTVLSSIQEMLSVPPAFPKPRPLVAVPFVPPVLPVKEEKEVPFDQPRNSSGERLLYKYPNLPRVGPNKDFYVLVGSSDKSASAWLLQFDGAANPNPGPASSGAVLWSPADERGKRSPIFEMGKFIGKNTNNVAEIQGLLLGLKMAAIRGARDLLIEGDSELIIFQQIGKYKVSHKNLKVWWSEIQAAMMDETSFDWIAIRHVRREFNERADSITKEVLSTKQGFTRSI
jgi:ribonuclease HI